MDGSRIVSIIAILMVLTLALRALSGRQLPAGKTARLALIWAGIFIAMTATILALTGKFFT